MGLMDFTRNCNTKEINPKNTIKIKKNNRNTKLTKINSNLHGNTIFIQK